MATKIFLLEKTSQEENEKILIQMKPKNVNLLNEKHL